MGEKGGASAPPFSFPERCAPEGCMQRNDMDRTGDTELVIAAREGDLDAFTELVDRYRTPSLRLAYGIAGADAEDAVQDAFVKLFRALPGFRTDAAFRPWLFTIVANEARNRRRSMTRRTKVELRVREQPRPDGPGADEVAEAHERRRRLVEAVAALPERSREVVALRFFASLSENETAEVLA